MSIEIRELNIKTELISSRKDDVNEHSYEIEKMIEQKIKNKFEIMKRKNTHTGAER
jgi:hypothetical protein